MHFIHFDLTFGVFENFGGFSKLMKFLWNFWDGFCLNNLKCSCIVSHLQFHNVSCIIVVCLLLLKSCVFIVVCMSRTIFSILLFLIWVGTFLLVSLSLSLSLSLFLSVSCSMAPKCKSASSWNSLHSRASSSNSTPFHIRFHDEKAHTDFSENFSRRDIHSECQVVLSIISDIDIPIVIYSRSWESLCGITVTCPSMIIQEFYSSMHNLIILYLISSLMFKVRAL